MFSTPEVAREECSTTVSTMSFPEATMSFPDPHLEALPVTGGAGASLALSAWAVLAIVVGLALVALNDLLGEDDDD